MTDWLPRLQRVQPWARPPVLSLYQDVHSRRWGTECGRSGMPRSGWPSVLPCGVRGGGGTRSNDVPAGAAGHPLLQPLPMLLTQAARHAGPGSDSIRGDGGIWGVSLGAQEAALRIRAKDMGLIGPAKEDTQNHPRLSSSIPIFLLKTPTHVAKGYHVCTRACARCVRVCAPPAWHAGDLKPSM